MRESDSDVLSSFEKLIRHEPQHIHKLKAKDATGRWAYYFIYIRPSLELSFLKALNSTETVELDSYGIIIATNYGEEPSRQVCRYLREKFGWTI